MSNILTDLGPGAQTSGYAQVQNNELVTESDGSLSLSFSGDSSTVAKFLEVARETLKEDAELVGLRLTSLHVDYSESTYRRNIVVPGLSPVSVPGNLLTQATETDADQA